MAARRYEISLGVLNNISRVSVCSRRDLLCNRRNGDIFTCEENMLFSRVKISCFRGKAHLVFHCCLYNKKVYSLSFWNCTYPNVI